MGVGASRRIAAAAWSPEKTRSKEGKSAASKDPRPWLLGHGSMHVFSTGSAHGGQGPRPANIRHGTAGKIASQGQVT